MYKRMVRYCGKLGIKYISAYVSPLKEEMSKSNLHMLFEIYLGRMIFFSITSFIVLFVAMFLALTIFQFPIWVSLTGAFVSALSIGVVSLTVFHSYPLQILLSKKNNIEGNMPFAINHMAAIASSGVPPVVVFKLLTTVKEYGELTNESKRIVRNMDVFGMDITSAIKNVADRTPSTKFKQFLYGIVSTIQTGGDLKKYLESTAKESLFDYKLKREKYLQTLSTYADFYTAVLIAAPLFFVSILSIMSLVGGDVMGLPIEVVMQLGIFVLIPLLNSMFIIFIHFTQPTI